MWVAPHRDLLGCEGLFYCPDNMLDKGLKVYYAVDMKGNSSRAKMGRPMGADGHAITYSVRPHKCLESHPTSQTVYFCGEAISLSAISMMTGLSIAGISYIFSGKYDPSLKSARKISIALGMTLEGFVRELEDYVATQTRYKQRVAVEKPVETVENSESLPDISSK